MHRETIDTPAGTIELETGRIARQAHGAVVLRHRDTVLLATAVAAEEPKPGQGFFPLTVEYRERLSAAGRIPGSFQRREGRITDAEVLTSRLADRSIRPQFPDGFLNEVQVLLTVLSADAEVDPEAFSILGAAAALHVSDVPWDGPLAGVRIAHAHGEWHLFPPRSVRAVADLDLVVTSGPQGMVMVEGEADEAPEKLVLEALSRADAWCREASAGLDRLRAAVGKEKRVFAPPVPDEAIARRIAEIAGARVGETLALGGKKERRAAVAALGVEVLAALAEEFAGREDELREAWEELVRGTMRGRIVVDGVRLDGRGPAAIRPIAAEAGWLPRPHGSAIFTRGETQALVTCTLGTSSDEQLVESLAGVAYERFLLHYNFPPYSVGETRALRGPGRREIGHGNLAHRALAAVLPSPEEFPYTLRIVSDISESNGSSSMATVCGGSLALMDAGVPLRRAVAGIAMGMIGEHGKVVVLSDILGDEDHLGDMDFKVAGTTEGITAIQLDNKLGAVPAETLAAALEQARAGRLHILREMDKALAAPRPELKPGAPRVSSLRIRRERIRDLIGSGGKTIQEIQQTAGVKIDVNDEGLVRIYAPTAAATAEALRRVRLVTLEPEVGQVFRAEVILVRDFFAIVKLAPNVEARLPIAEVETHRIGKVQDVLKPGDTTLVRVLGVDAQGKILVSRKAAKDADESDAVI